MMMEWDGRRDEKWKIDQSTEGGIFEIEEREREEYIFFFQERKEEKVMIERWWKWQWKMIQNRDGEEQGYGE